MISVKKTEIDGVLVIEPKLFGDNRGWFTESYSRRSLAAEGLDVDFVQDNRSYSALKGTVRGLHFQKNPFCQAKLVSCLKGAVLDVAVDLRSASPTFKKWVAVELSEENKKQLFIPKGFAHGFMTLSDDTELFYKCDAYYSPEHEGSIRFDDPELALDWRGLREPVLSEKDKRAPFLRDADFDF